jgi:hypothetical protein
MKLTRRSFLKRSAVGTAVLGFPTIVPSSVFGQDGKAPPSERVGVALIGCGNRSSYGGAYARHAKSQVVAVCDPIHTRRLARKQEHGNCPDYGDFREVLAAKNVDAVHIATPDHWHVPIAMMAAKAGKDMYTEKPLGICVAQDLAARPIVDVHKRIFQYGAQQRSIAHVRMGIELVLNGLIGDVQQIYVWAPHGEAGGSPTPVIPVPEGFDYNMWLGPAPEAPFCHDRCLQQGQRNGIFHIYDYAIGFIAGWGAHPMDMMQWWADNAGLETVPVKYEGKGTIPTSGLFNTLTHWDVTCTFANGLPVRFMDDTTANALAPKPCPGLFGGHGTLFVGKDGWVNVNREGWKASSEDLLRKGKDPGPKRLPVSRDQIGNFVDCVLSREQPVDHLHSAIRSDVICHLSDICIREGKSIAWDPVKETIVGNPEAAKRLQRPMRAPWTV